MIRKITLSAIAALAMTAGAARASEGGHVVDFAFSFEGPFGSYDTLQLQRGLKVYTEVCSACHGLKYVPIRSIGEPGGPELPADQVRAYAAQIDVTDPATGESRPATPTDHFPPPQLAEAPDLSVMAKARAGFHGPYGLGINQLLFGMGGPEYIATLLSSFEDPPACAPADFPGYYNKAFVNGGIPETCRDKEGHPTIEGSWIAMPPPLTDGAVEFDDHAPNDVTSMSEDVAAFLMWAAEPKLDARKEAGFQGVLFLIILSVLLYLTNKSLWRKYKHRDA